MTQNVGIKMLGDKALERKLWRLPSAMQKKIVRASLRVAAKIFVAPVKHGIPIVRGVLASRTKVKVKSLKRQRGRSARIGVRVDVFVPGYSSGAQRAIAAVEMGTSDTAPKPFIRPAFHAHKSTAKRIIANEIRTRVTAEAMKP